MEPAVRSRAPPRPDHERKERDHAGSLSDDGPATPVEGARLRRDQCLRPRPRLLPVPADRPVHHLSAGRGRLPRQRGPRLPAPGTQMEGRRVHPGRADPHGPDPRGATAPGGEVGPLPHRPADAAPGRGQGGALRRRDDRGGRRLRGLRLPPPAGRRRDGLDAALHHGPHRAPGPPPLRRERPHGTGRPRRRGVRLRGHGHRRPATPQLPARVLGWRCAPSQPCTRRTGP